MKKLLFFLSILYYCNSTYGQVPTISGFNPLSGPIGTTVTIAGSNFSSAPSNNIVYFGSVKALVTSANTTQLTVTVPGGLNNQPISVNVGGLTAFSSKPFITTFSGGAITANSFSCAVTFLGGPSLSGENQEGSIADFDGDGKPDLSLINDYTSNAVEVRRNNGSPGTLTSSSFESAISFTNNFYDIGIDAQDIDGDGNLDLISDSRILRNTSVVGSISTSSFSAAVNYGGPGSSTSEPGDIDGDGKIDIVALDYFANRIAVIKNNSTPGFISSGSFSAPVYFATAGTSPSDIKVADIDGDFKPDVIMTRGSTLSIFRNTSSSGVINVSSLANRLDFSVGSYSPAVAIGDLNNDGKADLIVANAGANTLTIFQNISTIGVIDLGAPITIVPGTRPMDVQIGDLNGDGKLDIISANEGRYDPSLGFIESAVSVMENIYSGGILDANSFNPKVDIFNRIRISEVRIGDIDGEGRPDIVIDGGTILLNKIGDPVLSISSIIPTSGPVGTPITITGTEFGSTPVENIVRFNGITATVTSASQTSLVVIVPSSATTGAITVTVACKVVTSSTFTVGSTGITIISQPVNRTVCNGGVATFSVSATGSGSLSYQWQKDGVGLVNGAGYSGVSTNTLTVNTTGNFGAGDYRCKISAPSATDAFSNPATLTISPAPIPPTVTGSTNCGAGIFVLLASGGSNGQYRWYTSPTGGTAIAGQTSGSYTTPPISTSTTYYVSIFNGLCESPRTSVVAEIKSCIPVIATAKVTTQIGGEAVIELIPLISNLNSPLDVASIKVTKQPVSGAKATISNGRLNLDYMGISFSGTDILTIEACDIDANCATQEFTIDVVGEVVVFNAISPNGDNKNEVFFLQYIDLIPNAKNNKVTIFNRWGDVVFEVDNYDNTENVFRGLNKNGNELPSGTYFYRIKFASGLEEKSGFISLKK